MRPYHSDQWAVLKVLVVNKKSMKAPEIAKAALPKNPDAIRAVRNAFRKLLVEGHIENEAWGDYVATAEGRAFFKKMTNHGFKPGKPTTRKRRGQKKIKVIKAKTGRKRGRPAKKLHEELPERKKKPAAKAAKVKAKPVKKAPKEAGNGKAKKPGRRIPVPKSMTPKTPEDSTLTTTGALA